jgi:hypothetical protein
MKSKLVTVGGKAFTGRAGGAIGNHHHFGADHPLTNKPVKMIGGKKWVGVDAFHYKKDAEAQAEGIRKGLGYLARVVPDKMWDYIVYIRSKR